MLVKLHALVNRLRSISVSSSRQDSFPDAHKAAMFATAWLNKQARLQYRELPWSDTPVGILGRCVRSKIYGDWILYCGLSPTW
jgi:hypothetical protein